MSLTKPVPTTKPAKALEFATAKKPRKVTEQGSRVFHAPEGYRRLTINVTHEMHRKLKLLAVEKDTTITDILTMLVEKELK